MTIRFCSRCGKALTDAASLEHGQGPICRGIDNHLYATTIEADSDAALVFVVGLEDAAPETFETVQNVIAAVAGAASGDAPVSDWRLTVKRIDWCLSWQQPAAVRTGLLGVMLALGYVGLAGIIAGQASVSPAQVSTVNGVIRLDACVNHHAAKVLKGIPNYLRFADKKSWSFPATAANLKTVREVVGSYYPTSVIAWAEIEASVAELEAARIAAAEAAKATFLAGSPKAAEWVSQAKATLPTKKPVPIYVIGEAAVVCNPYFHGSFLSAVKSLPAGERVYSKEPKIIHGGVTYKVPAGWVIAAKHLTLVQELVSQFFGPSELLDGNGALLSESHIALSA